MLTEEKRKLELEAAMAAGFYKVNNLIGFVDYNKIQLDGRLTEVMKTRIQSIQYRLRHIALFRRPHRLVGSHISGALQLAGKVPSHPVPGLQERIRPFIDLRIIMQHFQDLREQQLR